jgi:hypothetical protein
MAYDDVTSTEIASGKPVATTVLGKVKDNFIDHEERLQELESGSAVDYPSITMGIDGFYGDQGPATHWDQEFPNFDLTIVGARLIIDVAGISGTTEIDILVKPPAGAFTSIYSTKPSASYTDGDGFITTNQILDPTKVSVPAGSVIRLDTTSVQTNGQNCYVRLDYTKGI